MQDKSSVKKSKKVGLVFHMLPNNPFFLTPEQAQTLLKEREEFRRLYLEAMDQLNFYKANPQN
jgi:hypothetical protein